MLNPIRILTAASLLLVGTMAHAAVTSLQWGVDRTTTPWTTCVYDANNVCQGAFTLPGTGGGVLVPSSIGGTGVNNGVSTITLGGSFTTSGAFPLTATLTGPTNVIFPTSGTLATTGSLVSVASVSNSDGTLTVSPTTGVVVASLNPPTTGRIGGVEAINSLSHNWIAYIDTSGIPHQSQPALSDISGASGTTNFVARWLSATTLGIGALYDNGTLVGIGTQAPSAPLTITTQTAALPALASAPNIFLVGGNGANAGFQTNTFAIAGIDLFERADGGLGTESALAANVVIGQSGQFRGYDGIAYSGSQAQYRVSTVGLWSGTNHGTVAQILTTPQNSTTQAVAFSAYAGVVIGNGTTDPGAGNILVGGLSGAAGFPCFDITGTFIQCTLKSTGDANYTILATDRMVYHTNLSVARTDTLPAASSVEPGTPIIIDDFAGVAGVTNTITAQRAGGDTINGVTSVVAINAQYGAAIFWSDGVSRWTFFPASAGGGSGTVTQVVASSGLSGGTITSTGTITMLFDPGSITNCTLSGTVSGNALTISLLTQSGATPSASSPCVISFRNATSAAGDYTAVTVTAATTFATGTTGSTFGGANATPFRLWITAWNNAGTVVLGASMQSAPASGMFPLVESIPSSTTACSACTTANAVGTFYTTAALTTKAFRILGYMDWSSGLTTAGVWASGPTKIQLMTPGTHKPGDTVQTKWMSIQTDTNNTTTSYVNTTTTLSITPTAAMNLIYAAYYCGAATDVASTKVQTVLRRGGSVIGVPAIAYPGGGVGLIIPTSGAVMDAPGSTGAQTYTVGVLSGVGGNNVHACGVGSGGSLTLSEIMS